MSKELRTFLPLHSFSNARLVNSRAASVSASAMGRAIVRDPKVFFFDDPLSNFHAKRRVQMRAEIKALRHRLNTSMVYVTHDQLEVMTMADRIVVMNGGIVEQIGAPLDLYDRPANLFVAGLIVSPAMNLIEGKVERYNNEVVFRTNCGLLLLTRSVSQAQDGKLTIFGICPEHMEQPEGRRTADLLPGVVSC